MAQINKPLWVDIELMKRYDKPGPRYTSYPTAPYFTGEFDGDEFAAEIMQTNQRADAPDLSLYFHLPFCDTLCYFCGCTMIITRNRQRIDEYLDFLINEVELISRMIKPGRKVAQWHWGGGTPTYLDPDQIRRISDATRQNFDFYDDAEISVEIDPRGLTVAHLDALQQAGFNRASMGVQDFNLEVQKAVNRLQSEKLTRWVFDELRARDFESINLDLIYGLPFQTVDSIACTLDRIIEIAPDRLAVFNYAHVPWMKKHQKVIKEETLPAPSDKLKILKNTIEKLTRVGYVYIGMDHFARADDSLTQAFNEKKLYRNFQGYSTKAGCDLYAFGMSSISQLQNVYAQNFKEIPDYYQALDEKRLPTERGYRLNQDDQLRRYVITKIMCDFELNKTDIEKKFNIKFDDYFADALAELEPLLYDGLVKFKNELILITEMGHLLVRNVAMAFDKYLKQKKSQNVPMYSKTI